MRTNYTDLIYYVSGVKYHLTRPYSFKCGIFGCVGGNSYVQIDQDGLIEVRAGYAWDGPSGPTADTPSAMRASLRHDVLYQLISIGILPLATRAWADQVLYWRWLADKTPKAIADVGYAVVRSFGGLFIKKK